MSGLPWTPVLSDLLGVPAEVRPLDSSPRSRVWRVSLGGEQAVVKQVVGGVVAGLDGMDAGERHAREVRALELAARADPPVAPRLLASDPRSRVLVVEYLPNRRTGEWPIRYAETLARLHGLTGAADAGVLPSAGGPTGRDADAFLALAAALGVAVPRGVDADLAELTAPVRGFDLLHGDPCPGNDRHGPDGMRLLDFEGAALGDGLSELAYLRIGLPTCWNSAALNASLVEAAESAYLAARGIGGREGLLDACAGWLLRGDALVERAQRGGVDHLARLVGEDWWWGLVSARERLAHRLAVAAGFAHRPAFARLCGDLHRRLGERWVVRPLPSRLVTWV